MGSTSNRPAIFVTTSGTYFTKLILVIIEIALQWPKEQSQAEKNRKSQNEHQNWHRNGSY